MSVAKSKDNLLVPIDFTKHSEKALVHAAQLADAMSLTLVILHVVHDPAEHPGYYLRRRLKKLAKRIEDHAQEMLESFIADMKKKYNDSETLQNSTTKMVVGLPVTRILEVADRVKPKMIVMGSHGRKGFPKLLIGSNAEKVVRLSKYPVTIVK